MQKKSFLNKLTAVMLLMASFAMVSCEVFSKEDNVIAKSVVETVATLTSTDPAAVSNALQSIVTDEAVAAAAAKGEPLKVTIAGSGVSTGASDQTITIPQKKGAAIEVNFATAPSGTESNALVLQADKGAGSIPSAASNNLVVTMPPSEGLAITIELPASTVTLKTDGTGAVVYKDVIAKTARSTIIIDKGVTIKEHELVGGNIVVKNGGAIETLAVTVKDNDGMVCLGSWWSGVGFKENGPEPKYEIKNEEGGYYMPKYLRIKKGNGNHITAWTNGPKDEAIESLTAGKGVSVSMLNTPQYKVIKGDGENELLVRGGIGDLGGTQQYNYAFASNTDLVSNFAIKAEIDDDPNLPAHAYNSDVANLIINFNAAEDNGSKTFTFENCNFDNNIQFALGAMQIVHRQHYVGFVNTDDEHPTGYDSLDDLLNAGIPNNIVERGERDGYWIDDEYAEEAPTCSDFTCILEFKNCKIGENVITKDNLKFPKWGIWGGNGNIHFKVIIGDNTYNVVLNDQIYYEDPEWGDTILEDPE